MPLDFNLYRSVSPEEMRAFQRVVGAARDLCVGGVPNGAHHAPAGDRTRGLPRRRVEAELAEALSDLEAVRARRTSRRDGTGTLAPWLHEYLRAAGRTSAWRPSEAEPMSGLASPSERARSVA